MTRDEDNNIVYFTRLHWIIFVWPAISLICSLLLPFYFPQIHLAAYAIILFCLAWVAITWINYYFSSLTIKSNQLILRTGMLVRETINIPLNKIEAVDIRQSIVGSLFRYGMISITGTGGTRRILNFIDSPLTCRRYIEQMMNQQNK